MVYDIVTDPDPRLHKPSEPVPLEKIKTREMQKFIKDMVETMYVKNGVGLAAVQVGRPIQLCIIVKQFNDLDNREDLCLINPTWKKLTIVKQSDEEGCLSLPGTYGLRKRYTRIGVEAFNKNGDKIQFVAEDFFARIIQHELDHLNGHLFVEKATKIHKVEIPTKDSAI